MNAEETSLEVLLNLWVVLFGEDVLWQDASTAAGTNHNVTRWFQALTQEGRLTVNQVDGRMHIVVVKGMKGVKDGD